MFDILYNNEVLDKEDFKNWRDHGTLMYGKENASMAVRGFFEWLAAADAQNQT